MGASRPFRQAVKCGAATIATGLRKLVLSGLIAALGVMAVAVGASGSIFYRRCRLHGGGPPPGTTTAMTCWGPPHPPPAPPVSPPDWLYERHAACTFRR